jgi:hypothetical protein
MKKWLLAFFIFATTAAIAQDSSLLNMMNDSMAASTRKRVTIGTFKATHIVNTQTVETPGRKTLQFIIMHRFGKLNEGAYALFGLDNATIRFGLDYGLTDRLAIGIGRSSYDKAYDASLKYKLLLQKEGGSPFTIDLYGVVTEFTQRYPDKPNLDAADRLAYAGQLLIARKFSPELSLQLTPGILRYNMVNNLNDNTTMLSLGLGGRIKVSRRVSINAEYTFVTKDRQPSLTLNNSFSAGVDIETGGHVFQLVFTNSKGMIEPYFIGRTQGTWGNGDLYFGFNISRIFGGRSK